MLPQVDFSDLTPSMTLLLDDQSDSPLYRQLYDALHDTILSGRLSAGTRLPATRAQELSVSRNTVVSAFEQLIAEGYIESRVGDGNYVSRLQPEELLGVATAQHAAHMPRTERGLLRRARCW